MTVKHSKIRSRPAGSGRIVGGSEVVRSLWMVDLLQPCLRLAVQKWRHVLDPDFGTNSRPYPRLPGFACERRPLKQESAVIHSGCVIRPPKSDKSKNSKSAG